RARRTGMTLLLSPTRLLPGQRLEYARQLRGELQAPPFEPVRLRDRAAPVTGELDPLDRLFAGGAAFNRPLAGRLGVRRRAAQGAEPTGDHELLHATVKMPVAQIDVLDPFLKSLDELPVRLRMDLVQAEAEAADLQDFLEILLLLRFRLAVRLPLHLRLSCVAIEKRHSARMPASLNILPHLTVSSFTRAANCSGEPPTVSTPMFANFLLISSCCRTRIVSWFRIRTVATGVPAGAHMPSRDTAS